MSDIIERTLEERGRQHGSFADNADFTQETRRYIRSRPNWSNLSESQKTVLDEIMLKVGRILSGGSDPDFEEPWLDIAGYAKLAIRDINQRRKKD